MTSAFPPWRKKRSRSQSSRPSNAVLRSGVRNGTAPDPAPADAAALRQRFDRLVATRTSFATLDRLLARMQANRGELLVVLDRPEVPLHTNDAENDLRAVVTRRKLSGGTRSDAGRACRDAFLWTFLKTCAKLGIRFWDYLGARLGAAGAPTVPGLDHLVRQATTA